MRKFIHSNFEIDLSTFKITDTAENPWFTGVYFAKYSYPFNLPLSEENDILFGFISHYNTEPETYFEGIYIHGDKIEKAVLEIEECERELSATIRYGLDDFPNFSKKLSELPLLELQVDDIYSHASWVINQAWPTVMYNFPQIHVDKIDTENNPIWTFFEKIINNYRNGAFLENTVDLVEEAVYNRNIIQPLPYLLYLIKAGVEAAGYTLHGDVLADTDLQKTLIYADVEYYQSIAQDSVQVLLPATEYEELTYNDTGSGYDYPEIKTSTTHVITQPGRYRITGKAQFRYLGYPHVNIKVKYRNSILGEWDAFGFGYSVPYYWPIDFTIDTILDGLPDVLTFEASVGYNEFDMTFDVYVNPIVLFDETGAIVPSIRNLDKVELTKAVPDMTYGDYVKMVLLMKNMSLDIKGDEIWINYIQNEVNNLPVVDLSSFEVKYPKRKFSKGFSFLLKYQEVEFDEKVFDKYKFEQVFQNFKGHTTSDYTTDDKTKELIINALPLPLLLRNEVQTAHAFIEDKSKPFFITYNGLVSGKNLSLPSANLSIPYLHMMHHKEWLSYQINSQIFNWSFLAYYEDLIGLVAKSKVHAYNNIHFVKSIQKTEVSPDLFDVEIETKLFE